jgi:hypothetical protein
VYELALFFGGEGCEVGGGYLEVIPGGLAGLVGDEVLPVPADVVQFLVDLLPLFFRVGEVYNAIGNGGDDSLFAGGLFAAIASRPSSSNES